MTTELAILFPIIMAVVLLIVHIALWAHASAVAQAAAEHGADIAAAFGADAQDGREAAERFVAAAGQIDDPLAVVTPSDDRVMVTVSGTYPSVFGRLDVQATSISVRELVERP